MFVSHATLRSCSYLWPLMCVRSQPPTIVPLPRIFSSRPVLHRLRSELKKETGRPVTAASQPAGRGRPLSILCKCDHRKVPSHPLFPSRLPRFFHDRDRPLITFHYHSGQVTVRARDNRAPTVISSAKSGSTFNNSKLLRQIMKLAILLAYSVQAVDWSKVSKYYL